MPPLVIILGTLTLLSGLAVLAMLLRRRHNVAAKTGVEAPKQSSPASAVPRLDAALTEANAHDLEPGWDPQATPEEQEEDDDEQEDEAYLAPPMVSSLDYLEQLAAKSRGDQADPQYVDELGANFGRETGSEARTMSKICPRSTKT